MVDILGLETALRAATTIIKIVFVFVFACARVVVGVFEMGDGRRARWAAGKMGGG